MKKAFTPPPESLTVEVESGGRRQVVTVRQLRIGQYRQAYGLMDSGDEPARLTLSTDMPLAWINELTPASYEAVVAADMKVNPYFFSFAIRQSQMRLLLRGVDIGGIDSTGSSPQQDLIQKAPQG